jgi:hypothetical protein
MVFWIASVEQQEAVDRRQDRGTEALPAVPGRRRGEPDIYLFLRSSISSPTSDGHS